jgi:hypothetical protein
MHFKTKYQNSVKKEVFKKVIFNLKEKNFEILEFSNSKKLNKTRIS